MSAPHDRPTVAEIVEAVREWIEQDVMTSTAGRLQFHARVAANMLSIVERELIVGPEQAERHTGRLASLGATDDAELSALIRSGSLDGRISEVTEIVLATVIDKLRVANPKYLDG